VYPLDAMRGTFMEMLDVHIVSAENGLACVEMVVAEKHLRTLEMMHGGMTATLMDTAVGLAAHSLCPDDHYSVTIQLDVKYTRPALPGQKLRGTGQVQHAGKRTAVAHGELRAEDGTLIATASATLMYLPLSR
jgi:uncharacterized protein (TIGR00369 family)